MRNAIAVGIHSHAFRALLAAALLAGAMLSAPGPRAAEAPTVLITGSSRGIGLELARDYAERGWKVIATCRDPAGAAELRAIAAAHPNVTVEALDVTNHAQIDALAAKYKGKPIDVLLNNAGIAGGRDTQVFGKLKYEAFDEVMAVNVIGPVKMTEAFIENVAASEQKKVINITSTQGSIASTFGGQYFYRASKAALNMITRSLAKDLKDRRITMGLVSPGFVRTDFTKGLDFPMMITPQESAAAVIKVIDGYTFEKSGTFMRHGGEEAPW